MQNFRSASTPLTYDLRYLVLEYRDVDYPDAIGSLSNDQAEAGHRTKSIRNYAEGNVLTERGYV